MDEPTTHGNVSLEHDPASYKPWTIVYRLTRRAKRLGPFDSVDLQHLIACMRDRGLPTEPLE